MYKCMIENTNPDCGVLGSCQTINEEGVYKGVKNCRKLFFYSFYPPRNTLKWLDFEYIDYSNFLYR